MWAISDEEQICSSQKQEQQPRSLKNAPVTSQKMMRTQEKWRIRLLWHRLLRNPGRRLPYFCHSVKCCLLWCLLASPPWPHSCVSAGRNLFKLFQYFYLEILETHTEALPVLTDRHQRHHQTAAAVCEPQLKLFSFLIYSDSLKKKWLSSAMHESSVQYEGNSSWTLEQQSSQSAKQTELLQWKYFIQTVLKWTETRTLCRRSAFSDDD